MILAVWQLAAGPAAAIYAGAAALRRALYRRGLLHTSRLGVPVISVGGLALGGQGKTPVARAVAERLARRGLRVGCVASGYGGRLPGCQLLPPLPWWEVGSAALELGDEPVLLASWLGGAGLVGRGRDKLGAARQLAAAGVDVVVVDDGLQHQRLGRDLEIIVGGSAPLPVPAGDGRELALGIEADLRWNHGRDGVPPPRRPGWICSFNRIAGLVDPRGRPVASGAELAGSRVFVVAGVARPGALVRLIEAAGAEVIGCRLGRDHRPLRPADLVRAGVSGADLVVCSEKDAARMAGVKGWWRAAGGKPVAAVTTSLSFVAGCESQLERALDRVLGEGRR